MCKKILLFLLLQLAWFEVLPFQGKPLTPYFEAVKFYNYIVKGEVINRSEVIDYHITVDALQIKITDKLGQNIDDTIWITPIIEVGGYPYFDYEELSGEYYFAFKSNDSSFFYDASSPFFILKITNDFVYSQFTHLDIFLSRLFRLHNRKMNVEKFETKIKEIYSLKKGNLPQI